LWGWKEWVWFSISTDTHGTFPGRWKQLLLAIKLQLLVWIPPGTSPLTLPLLCCSGRLRARRQHSWRAQMCAWMCTRWLSCGVTTCLLLMTLQSTPTSLGSTGSTVSGQVLCVGQTLPKGAGIPQQTAFTGLVHAGGLVSCGSNLPTLLLHPFFAPIPFSKVFAVLVVCPQESSG